MIVGIIKLIGYFFLWALVAAALSSVFGENEGEPYYYNLSTWIALMVTYLIYRWRKGTSSFGGMSSRRLLSTSRLRPKSSSRSSRTFSTTLPQFIFENDPIPASQMKRLRYHKRFWKATERAYDGLLKIAPQKMFSTMPRDIFSRSELIEVLANFKAKHMRDFYDEVKDHKLDWNNENCKLFFVLMEDKYKVSQRDTITALLYLSHEIEYHNYYDAMQIKTPKSAEELIRQTVLYDIYREKNLSENNVHRYAKETGVSISWAISLENKYEKEKQALKIETFETNLRQDDKRRTESIEEQLRHATREEYFQIANVHELVIDTQAYHISSQDYNRESSLDRYYKTHFAFALTQAFGGLCCKCGEGMSQLEFDHFWLPKKGGGNFLMRSKQGYYVNNCIPLCRSCNASKGARSFLEFFANNQIEEIVAESQSMNTYLNTHMVDYEDLHFEDRVEV